MVPRANRRQSAATPTAPRKSRAPARVVEHTNGVAATQPALGPQTPQRVEWVDLRQDYYPDHRVQVWCNMPGALYRDIYSGDFDKALAALLLVVKEHNGWRDYEGKPYPPADTREFWTEIPTELFRMIVLAIDDALVALPNLLMATRLTSSSSSVASRRAALAGSAFRGPGPSVA